MPTEQNRTEEKARARVPTYLHTYLLRPWSVGLKGCMRANETACKGAECASGEDGEEKRPFQFKRSKDQSLLVPVHAG